MTALGWIATALTAVWAVPQWTRLRSHRAPDGVAVGTYTLGATTAIGWLAFGLVTGSIPVVVSSGLVAIVHLGVVMRFARRDDHGLGGAIVGAVAWACVLVLTGASRGATALGLVLAAAVALVNGPQVVRAVRSRALRGVSAAAWVLALLEGVAWGFYGAGTASTPLVAYGVVQTTSAAVVLARSAQGRLSGAATVALPEPASCAVS